MTTQIALGLGDNVDYEIRWDARVIEDLVLQYGIRADEITSRRPIQNERDLAISILSFVQTSQGGERTVVGDERAANELIERFAARFENLVSLGGTSVRSAIAMRKLGYTSALHLVTLNDHVRRLLPADCKWVCSGGADSLYPHLIVQFGEGACVRAGDIDLLATRPNRIIYHRDEDNIRMRLDESFGEMITEARVFLISGFNAMQSESLLRDRLATLQRILARLPRGAQVFFEDAGYYNPAFSSLVLAELAGQIDIFSLNEDELQGHLGRTVDMLDATAVGGALAEIQRQTGVPTIVVHSMRWAAAYGENAARAAQALKGGVTMATTRFCFGDDFSAQEYWETAALPPNPEGARTCEALNASLADRICCVPVAQVNPVHATTIGLGDAFVGGFLPALADTV